MGQITVAGCVRSTLSDTMGVRCLSEVNNECNVTSLKEQWGRSQSLDVYALFYPDTMGVRCLSEVNNECNVTYFPSRVRPLCFLAVVFVVVMAF